MTHEEKSPLFTLHELLRLQAIVKHHLAEAAKAPPLLLFSMLSLAGAAAVAVVEWEIIYRVFDYLAGEANNYWSPKLMACSSVIVIVGFHLLARSHPSNPAVQLVDGIVGFLIPAYLLGVGLLIASILYADGLGAIAAPEPSLNFGGPSPEAPPEAAPGHWLDALFSHLVQPLSVLVFALGIGGLAICNIFVTHRLLTIAQRNARDARVRWRNVRDALADHRIIKRTQRRYGELSQQLVELDRRWDTPQIREAIVCDVLGVIAESLLPHKTWLTERALRTASRFEQGDGINTQNIVEQIARIEAISGAQVLDALNPHHLEHTP